MRCVWLATTVRYFCPDPMILLMVLVLFHSTLVQLAGVNCISVRFALPNAVGMEV